MKRAPDSRQKRSPGKGGTKDWSAPLQNRRGKIQLPIDSLHRVERARRAMSASTRVLVRAETSDELMREVSRIAVDVGGYLFAWAGIAGNDAEKSVKIGGQYGPDGNYLSFSGITYNGRSKRGKGPTGTAIRTAKPALIRDATTEPSFAPWRENAAERGFASVLALPLMNDGKAFGAFTVYAREIDAFDEEEISLLETLANEIAFGVVARQNAAEQHQAEQGFQAVFRANPSLSAITDPETGMHHDVNLAWCSTLGYSREEVIGRTSAELGLWANPEQRRHIVDTIRTHGSIRNADAQFRAKNGTLRDLLVSGELIEMRGDKRLLLTSQDITERKKSEKALWEAHAALEHKVAERTRALHESEDRLRDFAEVSADWMWETDADHRFTLITADTKNTSVHTKMSVIGKTRLELVNTKLDPKKWARHKRDLELHKPFRNFEYPVNAPDGALHWIRINGKPLHGGDGTFLGYRGTGMDVTAEIEARNALAENEKRFRNLVESSLQGIYIHRNLKPFFANPAMVEMFGYDNLDAFLEIGSILELFDEEDALRLEGFAKARAAGKAAPQVYEAGAVKKDGTPFRVQILATVIEWDGKPAIQAAIIDITERYRAEQKMRTALENAELANRTKTEFLANMSHELRTPLNAV
ncbi:MAG: PAS domain S-box protein, partial [Rhodospirillales bacterium]|nr:PAS domain S-box protein [Rhodospirillales bacterium]